MEVIWTSLCFISILSVGQALECYVCAEQRDNRDKCVKTVRQCEQNQDTCVSHTVWKPPPFWAPRGERVHYISKGCGVSHSCKAQKRTLQKLCKRDWYNDWHCMECCTGDLCNYYVTMGSSAAKSSFVVLMMTSLAGFLWNRI